MSIFNMEIGITTTKLWDDNTRLVFKRLYNLHNYINFSFIEGVNRPNCKAIAKQFKMYCIGSLFYKDHDFKNQLIEACALADKCDVKYLMLGSGRYRPAIERETSYTELFSIAYKYNKTLLFEPIANTGISCVADINKYNPTEAHVCLPCLEAIDESPEFILGNVVNCHVTPNLLVKYIPYLNKLERVTIEL